MACTSLQYVEGFTVFTLGLAVLCVHIWRYRRHRRRRAKHQHLRTHTDDSSQQRIRHVGLFSCFLFVLAAVDARSCMGDAVKLVKGLLLWTALAGIAAAVVEVMWCALSSGYAAVKMRSPKTWHRKLMIASSTVWIVGGMTGHVVEAAYSGDDVSHDEKVSAFRVTLWLYWVSCVVWFLGCGVVACFFLMRVYRILHPDHSAKKRRATVIRVRKRILRRCIVVSFFTVCGTIASSIQLVEALLNEEALLIENSDVVFLNSQFPVEMLIWGFLVWLSFIAYPKPVTRPTTPPTPRISMTSPHPNTKRSNDIAGGRPTTTTTTTTASNTSRHTDTQRPSECGSTATHSPNQTHHVFIDVGDVAAQRGMCNSPSGGAAVGHQRSVSISMESASISISTPHYHSSSEDGGAESDDNLNGQ